MSAIMPDQSNKNVAEFLSPGPGERLRAARLSLGYDLAKIASELHLTSPVVEALEADDFKDIGARVFVRGYLRNYARIVGMPVESILRQFDEKWPDEAQHSMVRQSPTLPADGGPSRGWAGAVTWLMVIALLALFLVWWRGYLDGVVPEEMRSTVLEADSRPLEPAGDPVGLADGPAYEALPPDGTLRLPAPPSDEPLVEEVVAEAPLDSAASAALPGEEGEAVPGAAAPAIQSAPAAEPRPPAAAVAPPTATAPVATPAGAPQAAADQAPADGGAPVVDATKQIVMTFTGACWVDVRDRDRTFKLFGEMPKGARRVLGGQPPYQVVIGNAKAVTITVNGQPFDVTRYAKGNVARFTLDP